MTRISIQNQKLIYNSKTKSFHGIDINFKFDTSYLIVNNKSNIEKKFEFTHSTGSEFDPNTNWVYESKDGYKFIVSQDAELTKKRAEYYLNHKLRN